MTLRLYKGYAFSSDYSEVMDCRTTSGTGGKSPHAAYLETLESAALVLDSVYLTYSGTINLDWDALYFGDITQYNYMALINDDLTLYAFIRDINYVNGIAVVTYDLDIWSSYSPKMTLRQSMRAATRFPVSGRPYALPAEYVTNEAPIFTRLAGAGDAGNVQAVIIYQFYKLSTDKATTVLRDGRVALMKYGTETDETTYTAAGSYKTISTLASQLVAQSGVKNINVSKVSIDNDTFYEISSVYLLPASFDLSLATPETAEARISSVPYDATTGEPAYNAAFYTLNTEALGVYTAASYAVPANAAILGVGVPSNIIPIPFDGLAHQFFINYKAGKYTFNLYFEIDGAIYNAEDNFELQLPFTASSAAETQQARIARQLEESQLTSKYWEIGLQATAGALQIGTGAAAIATGAGAAGGVAGVLSGVSAISSAAANLRSTIETTTANAMPRRLWAGGTQCQSTAQYNSTAGVGYMSIAPANTNEVKEAIAEGGYNIAITTSSLDIDDAPAAIKAERRYDIVRYSFARISGQLSETIKDQLRSILVSGFKLWYTTPTT